MGTAEARIDGAVSYRAGVRYDAYGEMSGQQSSSIALLDSHRSGVVLSSILHRENARVYVKQVTGGRAEHELSPEEQEAVASALAAEPGGAGVVPQGQADAPPPQAARAAQGARDSGS